MFKIYHFKRLNSTNTKAKFFGINSVIIADEQIKGKGRFKRNWKSSKGGIYLSLVLPKTTKPQFYTFIAALSAKKALNIKKIRIKWPNDLIYGKKKVCGILTELKEKKAIVGIGINTNNEIPFSLKNKAISLKYIKKKGINNEKVIKVLLKNFESYLKSKQSKIIRDWKRNSFLGSQVKVKTLNGAYKGIAYDIDKDCFLILKDKNGNKIQVREGDIIINSL